MQKIKNQTGMTLAEVLVTISIIVVVSSIVFLSGRTVSSGGNVKLSAYRLASEIRKMQSNTLNLKFFNTAFPTGGWGMFLTNVSPDNLEYVSYADLNENQKQDTGEISQTFELANRVKVKEIRLINGANPPILTTDLYLTFVPPDPKTYICSTASGCVFDTVEIVISDNTGVVVDSVLVNSYGLIEVHNNVN